MNLMFIGLKSFKDSVYDDSNRFPKTLSNSTWHDCWQPSTLFAVFASYSPSNLCRKNNVAQSDGTIFWSFVTNSKAYKTRVNENFLLYNLRLRSSFSIKCTLMTWGLINSLPSSLHQTLIRTSINSFHIYLKIDNVKRACEKKFSSPSRNPST